jgi:mono/diheme cytochrome c family protein
MIQALLITHRIVVTLFFLIYVIKTILLLSNKQDLLQKFTKTVKVPEMIVSAMFLITGVYLLFQLPSINNIMIIKLVLVFASIPVAIIGFKKGNKLLAALSLLMITASYGLAEVGKKKREKGADIISTNINGREIYEARCASCHGLDGKAGLSGASDLSASAMDKEQIMEVIRNGKNTMPPVDITPEQSEAVAVYLENSVKGK